MRSRNSKNVHQSRRLQKPQLTRSVKMFLAALTTVALSPALPLFAQDNEWIGGASTDYHNAANWSLGVVPTNVQTAIIDNSTVDAAVQISSSVSVGSVTINAGDKLSVNNSRSLTIEGLGGPTIFNNDGEFELNSTGSVTSLILNEQTLLDGLGVLSLNGSASRVTSANNSQLYQSASHTIRGGGSLGFDTLSIVNDGLILADAGTLTIDTDANGLQNNGTLRADGGNLLLTGFGDGDVTNNGTIEALDGSNVLLQTGIIVEGGTLATAGSGSIRVQSGDAEVRNISNQGNLVVENSRTLAINGNNTNDGNISLATVGSATVMSLTGDTTIGGSGTTTLGGSAARISGSTFTLTNDGMHTIEGRGNIGFNQIGLVNNSTIEANVSGGDLLIDPETTLGVVNNGTMKATNGGSLTLSGFGGGSFQNNGLIAAEDNSTVNLITDAQINGGVLGSSGTGKFVVGSGNASIADLTSNAQIEIANSRSLMTSGILTNNGSINTASVGSSTAVSLAADTTFSGSGNIRLQNGAAAITGISGSLLTQDANHSIFGHGALGANNLEISNSGSIVADTGTLVVDPGSAGLQNLAMMKATGGGVLELDGFGGGTFANSGVIRAEDASQVLLGGGAEVIGGTLDTMGTGQFRVQSGNASFQDLTFNGDLVTENSRSLNLLGSITNNGTMSTASVGSITSFYANTDTTMSGTGQIALQNGSARVDGISGTLFTQEMDHSIEGFGAVGFNNLGISNLGTITADGGTLNLDPHSAAGLTNSGLIQANSGATLGLDGFGGGVFDNTSGSIQAHDGGAVRLHAGAEVTGGVLQSTGTGVFNVSSGDGTISNLTNNARFNIENSRTLGTNGSIVNNGLIRTASVGSSTTVSLASDTNFGGSGSIELQNSNARLNGVTGSLLTNGADHSITGFGNVGFNNLDIQNNGTISANVSGATLVLDPGAVGLINSGSIMAENGGQILFDSFASSSYSGNGLVAAYDGSSVVFESGSNVANLSGGVLQGGSWSAMDSGAAALIDFQQSADPITQIGLGTTVSLSGVGAEIRSGGQSLSNTLAMNQGNLNLMANHIMAADILENQGDILIDGAGTLLGSNEFVQTNGQITLVNGGGISGANSLDIQGGLIQGNGTIYSDMTLQSSAMMAAGQSAGILDITGNADLLGDLEIEIAGIQVDGMLQDELLVNRGTDFALADFDQVNVFGDLLLDGNLDVSFIDGYSLTGEQFYDVVTADTLTVGSNFAIVNNTGASFSYSVETLTDSVSGSQRDVLRLSGFSAVPEPSTGLVIFGLAGAVFLRRRRSAGQIN